MILLLRWCGVNGRTAAGSVIRLAFPLQNCHNRSLSHDPNVQNPEHLRSLHPDQTVILIAEDEVMIRNITRIVLESEGYFILTSHDGEEALELSRKFPGTIHAVLSDVKMPNMDGLELRERLLAERPGIKVLLMSGYMDTPLPANVEFLAKPFGPDDLKDRIRQLLASPASV